MVLDTVSTSALARVAAQLDTARLRRAEPLAPYTTFKIGGPADLFYPARSAADLAHAVMSARRGGVPVFVLGLGANILVGDRGFRGLVVRNEARAVSFHDDGRVDAESGASVGELIHAAVSRGCPRSRSKPDR